jgi:hypothetical protein
MKIKSVIGFNFSSQNLDPIAAGWLIENCCKSVKKLLRTETGKWCACRDSNAGQPA